MNIWRWNSISNAITWHKKDDEKLPKVQEQNIKTRTYCDNGFSSDLRLDMIDWSRLMNSMNLEPRRLVEAVDAAPT